MNGYPHAEEWNWTPNSYHTKFNAKFIKCLDVTANLLELLDENVGINLCGFRSSNGFLDTTPKVYATKKTKKKKDFLN
jgi:hypothetical protein